MNATTPRRWPALDAATPVLVAAIVRATRSGAALLLTALVTVALLPAALAVTSGVLVSRLVSQGTSGRSALTAVAVAVGVIFLLQQILPPVVTAGAEAVGRRVNRMTADRVMAALGQPAGIAHLDRPRTAELVTAINGGLSGVNLRDAVVGAVNLGIFRGGAAVGGLVLFAYRWWVALLLLGAYIVATAVISWTYRRQMHSSEGMPARMRRAVYLKELASTAPAAKEVRVFGLSGWLLDGYRAEWRTAITLARRERAGVGWSSLAGGLLILAVQGLTFVLLASDVRDGVLSVGAFTTFAVAATGLLGLNMITPDLINMGTGAEVLRGVLQLEDEARRLDVEAARDQAGAGSAPAARRSIVFEGVGFRYPGSEDWVLRGLDLTLTAGTSTAVVGVNGAGKTTLVKLLCGLYRPTEGRILVDGTDLAGADLRAWQRECAVLFQDWIRWGLTVRENVLLGAPDRPADDTRLAEVADASGLSDVVRDLPNGWDTVLSRQFDGVDLSGGQWQRVGLARALWASGTGSAVLVLDEPTAALDVRGEAELFDRMLEATRGKTVLLISHRFSTVRYADQIVVLQDGAVYERGDHQTLVTAGGRYAEMFAVQAERFVEDRTV